MQFQAIKLELAFQEFQRTIDDVLPRQLQLCSLLWLLARACEPLFDWHSLSGTTQIVRATCILASSLCCTFLWLRRKNCTPLVLFFIIWTLPFFDACFFIGGTSSAIVGRMTALLTLRFNSDARTLMLADSNLHSMLPQSSDREHSRSPSRRKSSVSLKRVSSKHLNASARLERVVFWVVVAVLAIEALLGNWLASLFASFISFCLFLWSSEFVLDLERLRREVFLLQYRAAAKAQHFRIILDCLLPSEIVEPYFERCFRFEGGGLLSTDLAQRVPNAGVLFMAIHDFEELALSWEPMELISFLNDFFSVLDKQCEESPGLVKIETVGEVYVAASGLFGGSSSPDDECSGLIGLANFALWSSKVAEEMKVKLRMGVHRGAIVAGIVGDKLPRFRLFGDTVNAAARLEQHCPPSFLLASEKAVEFIKTDAELMATWHSAVEMKGLGEVQTYRVHQKGDDVQAPIATCSIEAESSDNARRKNTEASDCRRSSMSSAGSVLADLPTFDLAESPETTPEPLGAQTCKSGPPTVDVDSPYDLSVFRGAQTCKNARVSKRGGHCFGRTYAKDYLLRHLERGLSDPACIAAEVGQPRGRRRSETDIRTIRQEEQEAKWVPRSLVDQIPSTDTTPGAFQRLIRSRSEGSSLNPLIDPMEDAPESTRCLLSTVDARSQSETSGDGSLKLPDEVFDDPTLDDGLRHRTSRAAPPLEIDMSAIASLKSNDSSFKVPTEEEEVETLNPRRRSYTRCQTWSPPSMVSPTCWLSPSRQLAPRSKSISVFRFSPVAEAEDCESDDESDMDGSDVSELSEDPRDGQLMQLQKQATLAYRWHSVPYATPLHFVHWSDEVSFRQKLASTCGAKLLRVCLVALLASVAIAATQIEFAWITPIGLIVASVVLFLRILSDSRHLSLWWALVHLLPILFAWLPLLSCNLWCDLALWILLAGALFVQLPYSVFIFPIATAKAVPAVNISTIPAATAFLFISLARERLLRDHLGSNRVCDDVLERLRSVAEDLLPPSVVTEMRHRRFERRNPINNGKFPPPEPEEVPFVNSFDIVSVMQTDLVGFTALARTLEPDEVMKVLNELFSSFDKLVGQHKVFKMETVGDAYICATGLPDYGDGKHKPLALLQLSLDLLATVAEYRLRTQLKLGLRAGLHSGPVIGGVVGTTMQRYHLFGGTMHVVEFLEATSPEGALHLSEAARCALEASAPDDLQKLVLSRVNDKELRTSKGEPVSPEKVGNRGTFVLKPPDIDK